MPSVVVRAHGVTHPSTHFHTTLSPLYGYVSYFIGMLATYVMDEVLARLLRGEHAQHDLIRVMDLAGPPIDAPDSPRMSCSGQPQLYCGRSDSLSRAVWRAWDRDDECGSTAS